MGWENGRRKEMGVASTTSDRRFWLMTCICWQKCISQLPDKILLEVFSYLRLSDVCRLARVCKAWRLLAYDGRLWTRVSLRPDFNGLHVHNIDALVALISARFGATLRYIELSADLITPAVLHELANRFAAIKTRIKTHLTAEIVFICFLNMRMFNTSKPLFM